MPSDNKPLTETMLTHPQLSYGLISPQRIKAICKNDVHTSSGKGLSPNTVWTKLIMNSEIRLSSYVYTDTIYSKPLIMTKPPGPV